MVVVRESPRAKHSPDKSTTQWPPKSPFQALLSSPSGRKRWQDRQGRAEERSPSPSPLRKPSTSRALQDLADMDDDDEEEDEDEETLQLRLQQIQAKLKLAKLRKANKQHDESDRSSGQEPPSSTRRAERSAISPTRLYRNAVAVPLSPVRDIRPPQEQISPARQRLGLTSVPKAGDVSLKRARDGSQSKRSRMLPSLHGVPKSKSFSERIAQSQHEAKQKQAKKDHLDQLRSSGFNLQRSETPSSGSRSLPTPTPSGRVPQRVKEEMRLISTGAASGCILSQEEDVISRSTLARMPRETETARSKPERGINPGAYGQSSGTGHANSGGEPVPQIDGAHEEAGYDTFSNLHLSKRHIEHPVVAREMVGKEVYSIPRLLKEIKAPSYDPPDCEADYIVFAVLASKSSPFDHAQTHKATEQVNDRFEKPRNKFMVLHLCDLKWEIDCFLFGTAFDQFWKLTPGTLLAIMNPAIMPPKGNQNNGRFSLKLGSSEDAVMEIGIARDLGYCSATKKDGQQCSEWVDKRKTEACEFHISLQIEKNRKGRMEVNTMFRGAGNVDDRGKSRAARQNGGNGTGGSKYHREYGQLYSVNTGAHKSTANLLDAEDMDALHNMTREEASRKRIANAQKERDLAKKLGEIGRGVGAEYMRTKTTHTASTVVSSATDDARNALFTKPTATELGLLNKKAADARMSPAKDRKKHFGLGAVAIASGTRSSEPMGWGGARKAGLLQPKESRIGSPERGQTTLNATTTQSQSQSRSDLVRPRSQGSSMRSNGSSSPVKKKARFALDRGIRTPGRDSLPGTGAATGPLRENDDDDDDDDLDIV